MTAVDQLLADIRRCDLCAQELPEGPRPVLAASARARLLIASQAPGRRVHASGVPWDDPSGDRLRDWLGMEPATFYDASRVALVPMGFCYPGTGRGGDLPPRPECARTWHPRLMPLLSRVELTIVIGRHALAWHLGSRCRSNLTATVAAWRDYLPRYLPLPHPSPRNQRWLKTNPWFAAELLPELRQLIHAMAL
jgi:uracil-DNA glycosylase